MSELSAAEILINESNEYRAGSLMCS